MGINSYLIQVKTLSFLTFLLRSYSDFLKTFEPSIVKSVMMLLQRCPEESVGTRKVRVIHFFACQFSLKYSPVYKDFKFLARHTHISPSSRWQYKYKPVYYLSLFFVPFYVVF
jgi:hypothetical protein